MFLELKGESSEEAMPWSERKKEEGSKKDNSGDENQEEGAKGSEWRRLRMTDAGEVNGVRFPPGIIIDVNLSDADKLIKSGKAEFVEIDDKKIGFGTFKLFSLSSLIILYSRCMLCADSNLSPN